MKRKMIIPSVNFHLWEPCNMRCKFCFATFQDVKNSVLPKGHLPKIEALKVVDKLAEFGFEKITFAGGEPTLCPWLDELIVRAKGWGMTTMLVTNGTRLNEVFLKRMNSHLDWIALSIDSVNDLTNLKTGRAIIGKRIVSEEDNIGLIETIKANGIRLKVNTVVHAENYAEDLNSFIDIAQPERWKILQVLPVEGQNTQSVDKLLITKSEFEIFLQTHSKQSCMVPEFNEDIKGSYVMIDPAGRFFHNKEGRYVYSSSILNEDVLSQYRSMGYNMDGFKKRGGIYSW